MFKKTVLAGLVSVSLLASAQVLAEDVDTATIPAEPQLNMNQEINRLQHMIQVGERSSELTDSELAQLNQTQERLRQHERDMSQDGLDTAETKRLRTMLREHENNIMAQRNNGERKQYQYQQQNQNGNGGAGQGNQYQHQHQNQNSNGDTGQGNLYQYQYQHQNLAPATANGDDLLRGQGQGNTANWGNAGENMPFGSASGFNFGGSSGHGMAGGRAGRSGR